MFAANPELLMALSLIVPGGGHFLMGERRNAIAIALAFYLPAMLAVKAASAGSDDLLFSSIWIALSVWLFAIVDAYETAYAVPRDFTHLNPRIAFLLNFCTRGLGYFYVDKPVWGAVSIVGFALVLRSLPPGHTATVTYAVLLAQSLIAAHSYHLAAVPLSLSYSKGRGIAFPCALVLLAFLVGWQMVSLACSQRTAVLLAGSPPAGESIRDTGGGVTFTLPSDEWQYRAETAHGCPALYSPRACVLLLRDDAPAHLGVNGYLVGLAGKLATQHGSVKLTGQRDLVGPYCRVHEVCYEWDEAHNIHATSHLYLVSQGDQVYTFLIAAPANLTGNLRGEIESLVTSVRFYQD